MVGRRAPGLHPLARFFRLRLRPWDVFPPTHLPLDCMTTHHAADRIEYVIASHQDELAAARRLVQTCYGRRGYESPPGDTQPGESTLLARIGKRVIGTVTVRSASRTKLQAEAGFAEHVCELRRQGRRLVEYTRFAIDRAWAGRHDLAAELIRRALLLGRMVLGATDCVIEVNPRHMRYYQREFGFTVRGPERTCERVGAPARLLHLDLEDMPPCVAQEPAMALGACLAC